MKLWQRIRMAGRVLVGRAAYAGAEFSRLMADWLASSLSPTREQKFDLLTLRNRAREMSRNSPLAEQFFTLLEQNVVGYTGFKLQGQVRNNDGNLAKPINDKIELAWVRWSKRVTTDGRMNLRELCKLALRTTARDGECFIQCIIDPSNDFGLSLHVWDADQLDHEFSDGPFKDGSRITMGIHHDRWGRALAYHFWNEHPDDATLQRKRVAVPAGQVIHLMRTHRYGQLRAVTWFAPVLVALRQLMGYIEAELVAARTGAAKMGFFKYKEGSILPASEGKDAEKPQVSANPGAFHWLPPNIDFQEWDPDHPTAAFKDFTKTIMRWVASGLHVSYNALANDLEGVNYTSLRSGFLIERDGYRDLQEWMIESFLLPLYTKWLEFAIDMQQLKLDSRDPARFLDVKFRPRGWQWVDPLKDAQAGVLMLDNMLTTHTELLAERGLDLEDVLEQRQQEMKLAAMYGVPLKAAVPKPAGAESEKDEDADKEKDEEKDVERTTNINVNLPEGLVRVDARHELRPESMVVNNPVQPAPEVRVEAAQINVHPTPVVVRIPEQPAVVREVLARDHEGMPTKTLERPATPEELRRIAQ